ncbi:Phytoene dehydrogenase-related protein [Xaviernesmea oryzae]|uniref:Pyridine nucleotide-disulfide oxidoreductase domain-containing protein 2 n=1 Tax=Xaviernesmea oryzae TaxID=464029 RepID=A0A1X7DQP6_9HYPH|nr:NAD(P)/FAD-dependent oxidoreductase [Xaviernesmea oryzae]SMF19892.1 Phytoene dehydrogenase-related protein [Xaviernesmea oryzae]
MTSFDVIIIGGGHNGLTAATLLGKSGRKVLLLEAAGNVGGALHGYEFHPGFRAGGLAHIVNRLDPDVAKLIGLQAELPEILPTVALSETGMPAVLRGAYGERTDGVTAAEAVRFSELREKLLFQAGILKRFLKRRPPEIGAVTAGDMAAFASAGWNMIRRGREEGRDFLRMLLMNVADVADEYLTDDRLKGLIAFDATLGIHLGPRSPTSLLGLHYRLTGEAGGAAGAQFMPRGGVSALAAAFEKAAVSAGVTIRTGTSVTRILADRGETKGIALASGEEISAPVVVSAIHPQMTFLTLVDAAELSTGFLRAVKNIRSKGNVARLDLALERVPEFSGVLPEDHRGRLVIARSIDHVENAFNPAKYGEFSEDPVMEITVPSLADPSLAPAGAATLSALVQFAPYQLGEGWEAGKPRFQKVVLDVLERHAPGIGKFVLGSSLMTPADIEACYHMSGGHWHHGELQTDQLLVNRPVNAACRYSTPLKGLYLASAGSHPGGGISGLPGFLAAQSILAGERR